MDLSTPTPLANVCMSAATPCIRYCNSVQLLTEDELLAANDLSAQDAFTLQPGQETRIPVGCDGHASRDAVADVTANGGADGNQIRNACAQRHTDDDSGGCTGDGVADHTDHTHRAAHRHTGADRDELSAGLRCSIGDTLHRDNRQCGAPM